MTFLEIQNQVLTWLDDINAGYFTRPQISIWINNAQREVQKLLIQAGENYYVTCGVTETVQNYDSYALPADFYKSHKLEIVTSGSILTAAQRAQATYNILQSVTPMEAATIINQGPGKPAVYYLKKDCMVLRAIPDRAYPLILTYSYKVSDMVADNSTPDVPIQYQ